MKGFKSMALCFMLCSAQVAHSETLSTPAPVSGRGLNNEYAIISADVLARVKLARAEIVPIRIATAQDRDICIEAGATDYMSKPINVSELCQLMGAWLGGSDPLER